MKLFRRISCQNLCKQFPKLFNFINLQKIDPALNNILTKKKVVVS